MAQKREYTVTLPDGRQRIIEAPEGASQQSLQRFAQRQQLQEDIRRSQRPNIFQAFGRGISQYGDIPDSIALMTAGDEEARTAAEQRMLETIESRPPGYELSDVSEAWQRGQPLTAGRELLGLTGQTIGESLGIFAPMIAGTAAAPFTKGISTAAGYGAVAGFFNNANLQRQAIERQAARERGEEPPEWDFTAAAAAAGGQTALTRAFLAVSRILPVGRGPTPTSMKELADRGESYLLSVARGTPRTAAAEIPIEIGQQALERAQAGLPLTGEEARRELTEAGILGALPSPVFGTVGRRMELARARSFVRAQQDAGLPDATETPGEARQPEEFVGPRQIEGPMPPVGPLLTPYQQSQAEVIGAQQAEGRTAAREETAQRARERLPDDQLNARIDAIENELRTFDADNRDTLSKSERDAAKRGMRARLKELKDIRDGRQRGDQQYQRAQAVEGAAPDIFGDFPGAPLNLARVDSMLDRIESRLTTLAEKPASQLTEAERNELIGLRNEAERLLEARERLAELEPDATVTPPVDAEAQARAEAEAEGQATLGLDEPIQPDRITRQDLAEAGVPVPRGKIQRQLEQEIAALDLAVAADRAEARRIANEIREGLESGDITAQWAQGFPAALERLVGRAEGRVATQAQESFALGEPTASQIQAEFTPEQIAQAQRAAAEFTPEQMTPEQQAAAEADSPTARDFENRYVEALAVGDQQLIQNIDAQAREALGSSVWSRAKRNLLSRQDTQRRQLAEGRRPDLFAEETQQRMRDEANQASWDNAVSSLPEGEPAAAWNRLSELQQRRWVEGPQTTELFNRLNNEALGRTVSARDDNVQFVKDPEADVWTFNDGVENWQLRRQIEGADRGRLALFRAGKRQDITFTNVDSATESVAGRIERISRSEIETGQRRPAPPRSDSNLRRQAAQDPLTQTPAEEFRVLEGDRVRTYKAEPATSNLTPSELPLRSREKLDSLRAEHDKLVADLRAEFHRLSMYQEVDNSYANELVMRQYAAAYPNVKGDMQQTVVRKIQKPIEEMQMEIDAQERAKAQVADIEARATTAQERIKELEAANKKVPAKLRKEAALKPDADLLAKANDPVVETFPVLVKQFKRITDLSAVKQLPTVGQTANSIRSSLKAAFPDQTTFDQAVFVVDDVTQLPPNIKAEVDRAEAGGAYPVALFDGSTGQAYLIADRVAPNTEFGVFLHEVGVHRGLEQMVGADRVQELRTQIDQWAESGRGLEGQIAREAVARANVNNEAGFQANDETIAYFVEIAVNKHYINPALRLDQSNLSRWFNKLMTGLRRALRSIGFNLDAATPQEIVDLAYGAAKLSLNTAPTPAGQGAQIKLSAAQESKRPMTKRVIEGMPDNLQEGISQVLDTVTDAAQRSTLYLKFTKPIVDSIENVMPSARRWLNSINKRISEQLKIVGKVDGWAVSVDKLNKAQFARTMDLGRDMTLQGKWAYQPTWRGEVKIDPAMQKRWNDLSPQEQQVLDNAFKLFNENLQEVRSASGLIAEQMYQSKLKRARTEEARNRIKEDRDSMIEMFTNKLKFGDGPYLPVRGVGSHITVGKSDAFIAAEQRAEDPNLTTEQRKEAIKALDKMRSDPNHFRVQFADSMREAKRNQRQPYFSRFGENVYSSPKLRYSNDNVAPYQAFERLRQSVLTRDPAKNKWGDKEQQKLLDMIEELYLTTLADTSARQSEQRRAGSIQIDPQAMYRSILSKGQADAHYISVLKSHKDTTDAYSAMVAEQKNAKPADRAEATMALNELSIRYEKGFDYDSSPLIGKVLNASAIWSLLAKPAYYTYNLTQPMMMGQPYLAIKHGYGRSFNEMVKAYQDIFKTQNLKPTGQYDLNKMPADIRAMLNELLDSGHIDRTIVLDLGQRIQGAGGGAAMRNIAKVNAFLRHAAQKTEMTNRMVMAASAYRLHLKANPNDRAGAVQYAREVIDATQGDYSNFNSPRILNETAFRRMITQFRKFQFIQAGLLLSMLKNSGLSTAEKRAATRGVMFMVGHHAVMAGAMGLPLMGPLAWAFNLLSDEEPKDIEVRLRRMLGDSPYADVLINGVPTIFNINVTQNLGLNTTFSIVPFADLELSRSGYESGIIGLMGPVFGLGAQVVDGADLMTQGDYYRGIASMMPGSVKFAMRAINEAANGVQNRRGDTLITPDEITFYDTIAKSLGYTTHTDYTRRMVRSKQIQFESHFNKRTAQLKNQYAKAVERGDRARMQEIREQWMEMQRFRRDYGFRPQPLSNLTKAPQEKREREQAVIDGVVTRPSNRGFVERLVNP